MALKKSILGNTQHFFYCSKHLKRCLSGSKFAFFFFFLHKLLKEKMVASKVLPLDFCRIQKNSALYLPNPTASGMFQHGNSPHFTILNVVKSLK